MRMALALAALAAVFLAGWALGGLLHGGGGGGGARAGRLVGGSGGGAAASVDPQRRQPQLRRELVERLTTDRGGVTGTPNPNHHWAKVFEKEGSPVFGRTHWRSDRRYERYAFTRIDGSRVHSTPDLAHLLANKRVALLGDSLSDQVYTMFLISLQKAGYEEYITQLGRMYSCNGTMHDTAEETLRKFWPLDLSHSDEVINWHDRNCDTWIQTSLIGGPFNITWKYWRTYKLPTKEGIKNTKYLLWPGVLDYLFENSDIVVVNLGAHYGEADQEELALHYEQLAVRMEAFNRRPGRLAFFRQTLTQHFYSTDGTGRYRGIKGHVPNELTNCHAAPNVFWQLFRHRLMAAAAELRGIRIQPALLEMNMPNFHFLFELKLIRRDCTHFAYIVARWAPVFDTMYRTAVEGMCAKGMAPERACPKPLSGGVVE
eukprot:SM000220S07061  [mRNA]  locus=s220:216455:219440:+ [translate_table: standard]